jgi:hypothetical protein
MFQAVTSEAREPIVCVNNVGPTTMLQMPSNTIGEFINRTEQLFLWQINLTSLHVNNAMVRFDLNDFWKIIFPFARIRGAVNSTARKR